MEVLSLMAGFLFDRVLSAALGIFDPLFAVWASAKRSRLVIFQFPHRVRHAMIVSLAICSFSFSFLAAAQDDATATDSGASTEAAEVDFKKLKSPIPYTKTSIKRGRSMFVRVCAECHGPDGKSQIDVIADATDLTSPKMYRSGITEGEVFRSIKDGAGVSMPPFKMMLKREEDMWHMVNFIRSLWPVAKRPQLQEEKSESTDKGETSSKNGGSGRD